MGTNLAVSLCWYWKLAAAPHPALAAQLLLHLLASQLLLLLGPAEVPHQLQLLPLGSNALTAAAGAAGPC